MPLTVSPRIAELEAARNAAAGSFDVELWAELTSQLKAEFPEASRVRIYAHTAEDGGGSEVDNLEVAGELLAPEDWMESEDEADVERIERLRERMEPLTGKLVGPCNAHSGDARWYQL